MDNIASSAILSDRSDRRNAAIGQRSRSFQFAARLLLPCCISILVLIPCFWQRRIQAGDLASHAYNVWLVQLIRAGKLPGVSVVNQSTNVLFDQLLDWLARAFSIPAAQRIAVSSVVLLFFWSAFALANVIGGKKPWFVAPYVAILAYGTIFNLGLFNYYLAGAFSLAGLAVSWRPSFWRLPLTLLLFLMGWLAQPLPTALASGALLYAWITGRAPARVQAIIWLLAFSVIVIARYALAKDAATQWELHQIVHATGFDQCYMFGSHYRLTTLMALALCGIIFVDLFRTTGRRSVLLGTPVQLYALCVCAAIILPYSIRFSWYNAWTGGISERLSWLAVSFLCGALAQATPAFWCKACFALLAAIFFSFQYSQGRALNQMEDEIDLLVHQHPAGSAFVAPMLRYPLGSGFDESMLVDRACIGHCFSFDNYEARTLQFRVRASPNNRFLAWSSTEPVQAQFFRTHPGETLYEIYPCGRSTTDLCVRGLTEHNSQSQSHSP